VFYECSDGQLFLRDVLILDYKTFKQLVNIIKYFLETYLLCVPMAGRSELY